VPFQPDERPDAGGSELGAQAGQLGLLIDATMLLSGGAKLEPALTQLLERLTARTRLTHAAVYRLNSHEGRLSCLAQAGDPIRKRVVSLGLESPGLVPWVAQHGQAVYVPDVASDPRTQGGEAGASVNPLEDGPGGPAVDAPLLGSEFAVPLRAGARLLGILEVGSDRIDGIRAVTRKLLEQFAAQVTFALERSELYAELSTLEEGAQLREELLKAQKMEALGALAAGVAHDFNNLLGVMLGVASLVRRHVAPDDPVQDSIELIEQAAARAAELTRQLLGFLRPRQETPGAVKVQDSLDRVAKIVSQTFDRRIQLRSEATQEPIWVEAEASELEQALLNLAINARDAMPAGGTLTFTASGMVLGPDDPARPSSCRPGEYVRMSVCDTGEGIAPQFRERIFEPFFTSKKLGQGTGLGLAMVERFVKRHVGFVRVESELGRGSEVSLYLPTVTVAEPRPAEKQTPQLKPGAGTVLVVDDEPLVLAFAERGLRRLGYEVLLAESGERALEIFRKRTGEIRYVLLDVVMPEVSGLEICRRLREIDPQARVIVSSGYSGRVAREALDAGASRFVSKPYTLEELSMALQEKA